MSDPSGRQTRRPGILYGVGYEGRTAEQLVRLLARSGVETVVDVRLNPISRKPGLSKTKLSALLAENGIEYVHERLLGNPRDNRAGFSDGRLEEAQDRFAARLANGSRQALLDLVERARNGSVAMLCVEADQRHCHRQVIADAVEREAPTILHIDL